jgi:hypothetical protein
VKVPVLTNDQKSLGGSMNLSSLLSESQIPKRDDHDRATGKVNMERVVKSRYLQFSGYSCIALGMVLLLIGYEWRWAFVLLLAIGALLLVAGRRK